MGMFFFFLFPNFFFVRVSAFPRVWFSFGKIMCSTILQQRTCCKHHLGRSRDQHPQERRARQPHTPRGLGIRTIGTAVQGPRQPHARRHVARRLRPRRCGYGAEAVAACLVLARQRDGVYLDPGQLFPSNYMGERAQLFTPCLVLPPLYTHMADPLLISRVCCFMNVERVC